jgi:hypothetical protein
MVAGPAGRRRCCPGEAKLAKIKRINKGVDDPHWIVAVYEVV